MPDRPIIVDGGSKKITITLPASAKQVGIGVFTIEPDSGQSPFTKLVVTGRGNVTPFSIDGEDDIWNTTIT